jgi:hypothetical protein
LDQGVGVGLTFTEDGWMVFNGAGYNGMRRGGVKGAVATLNEQTFALREDEWIFDMTASGLCNSFVEIAIRISTQLLNAYAYPGRLVLHPFRGLSQGD